jgi:Fe-Mn family superoxide dismutase
MSKDVKMIFPIIEFPFAYSEFEPKISSKTMETHYEKHYKGYMSNLNKLSNDSDFDHMTLEDVIFENFQSNNALFQNAAQAWNHIFYWKSMSSKNIQISKNLSNILTRQYESVQKFKDCFIDSASNFFGSGWVWVAQEPSGKIIIVSKNNANNPMTDGNIPLLVCDIWEHAYYLDYQNEKMKYVSDFLEIVNWDFLEKNLNHKTKLLIEQVDESVIYPTSPVAT